MTKINKLTKEQEIKLEETYQNALKLGYSTAPLDLKEIEESITEVYALLDKPKPEIVYCQSPWQMAQIIEVFEQLEGTDLKKVELKKPISSSENPLINNLITQLATQTGVEISKLEEMVKNLNNAVSKHYHWWTFHANWYLYWLNFYDFPRCLPGFKYDDHLNKQLDVWLRFYKCIGGWAPYEDICFICERPTILTVDDRGRLHGEDGPAIAYSDGYALFAWHGLRMNSDDIQKPLTIERIESENNVEVRRALIEKYGLTQYMLDSGAEVIHEDDFGTLLKKTLEGDEDIYQVKVVNSTAEPDGTYKDYFLGVDPRAYGGLKTAKAAVASTWRNPDNTLLFKSPDDYIPMIQT